MKCAFTVASFIIIKLSSKKNTNNTQQQNNIKKNMNDIYTTTV